MFDTKDAMRISDIRTKSKGRESKALALAAQMAKSITKADKALRRACAAKAVAEHAIASIFFIRHRELVSA